MEVLTQTQSQGESDFTQISTQEIQKPWGRLIACSSYWESYDLFESAYTWGRGPDCDLLAKCETSTTFKNISKCHFRIWKEDEVVYITDLSKNGTVINHYHVGRGSSYILDNDDIIAVGLPSAKVYIFSYDNNLESNHFLPKDLRKKYFVKDFLGKGAYGDVRLALEKGTAKRFALKKIITSNSIADPTRIATEIQIMSNISHPCIINLHESIESSDCVFLVLEYMSGGDLSHKIKNYHIREDEAKFIFFQMLLAVKELHDHGVTHRDIKPENVLMESDKPFSLIKIADFGLSKIMDEASVMLTTCGTLSYAAPEVLTKTSPYNKKVDVWSLGVMLFYMLSKKLPFHSTDEEILARSIIRGKIHWEVKTWKNITFFAQSIITKMLTVNPTKRISIDEIFQHPWIKTDEGLKYKINTLNLRSSEDPPVKKARYDFETIV